jgi:purine-binding chemotaxis protein CheW
MTHTDWNETEQAILDARSRTLAAPPAAPGRAHIVDLIHFLVAGERYAMEAGLVRAVAALVRLTPLPHAPPPIAGMACRAGAVFPVLHMRALLDLPLAALAEHSRVLLIGSPDPELGLAVDAVEAVRPEELASLDPPPTDLSAGARAFVRGVAASGVLVLDGAALLASDRLYVDIPLPTPAKRP